MYITEMLIMFTFFWAELLLWFDVHKLMYWLNVFEIYNTHSIAVNINRSSKIVTNSSYEASKQIFSTPPAGARSVA